MKTTIETEASGISQILKTLRDLSGLKAREVAEKAGISKNTLSNAENGKGSPYFDTAEKILEVYGKKLKVVDIDAK
ncbi:helix-turn-helix domain-containing protein [Weissella paramesenteroides]|uniref:helix-turn-helix domain-containing protein n=1 Tax=Weissella paramesenteroides TaxID=1249 RepID=UPI00376EE6B0